jgi:pyruvate dehydrogenase E1 component
LAVERQNRLHPEAKPQESYVAQLLEKQKGPIIAATDYMRMFAEQIRPFIKSHYVTLGTDGYGRSDTRTQLRHFFEVDAKFIVVAALKALADEGQIPNAKVTEAIKRYGINPAKDDPANH